MTLLEFITDLQSQGFTDKEVFDKAQEFKKNNATEEVVEETEVVEEIVEVGNSNDSPPTGADVNQTTAAPDKKETTDLILEDGSSVSAEEFEKRKAQYEEYTAVAKPEEVITEGGYDYKYDNKGIYYYKPKGSEEEWKTYENKKSKANLSIASLFNHSDFSIEESIKTEKALEQSENLLINIDSNVEVSNNKNNELDKEQQVFIDDFVKDTSLTKKDNVKISEETDKWFNVGAEIPETEYDTTYAKEVPTGKMLPNSEWVEAEQNAKAAWQDLKPKPEGVNEDEWIKNKMKLDHSAKLTEKEKGEKLETWIENNDEDGFNWRALALKFSPAGSGVEMKDIFDRSSKQKLAEAIVKKQQLNLQGKNKDIIQWFDNAKKSVEEINTAISSIYESKFQTPKEAEEAKALVTKLRNKRDEIVKLGEEKEVDLNSIIEEGKDVNQRVDYLERNFNFVPILTTNLETAGLQMGVALADVAHMALDVPNAFGLADNKYFNAVAPVANLAAKLVQSQPYKETREKMKSFVDNYTEQSMSGIAHAQSLSDLEDGEDWGRYMSTLLGSQAINTAILFGTGGAALPILTASAVGSSYGEMEKEMKNNPLINYSPWQMYGVAMGNGVLEYGSERISLGIIGRSKALFKASGPKVRKGFAEQVASLTTKKGATRAFKSGAYTTADLAKESGSEGFVEYGGNWFDRYVLGKDVNLFDGVADATFSGLVMSGGVYKAPSIFASVSQMVQGPDSNAKIAKNREKIQGLQEALMSSPDMSDANRARLNDQIVSLTKDSSNEINKTLNRFTEMDRSEIDALSDLELSTYKNRLAVDEVNSDPNFNNKEIELKRLADERYEINQKKNKILEPYIKADADIDTANTVKLTERIDAGSKTIADQLKNVGGFNVIESSKEFADIIKEKGIDGKRSNDYGVIYKSPETGKKEVLINQQQALKDNVATTSQHEVLHAVGAKTFDSSPESAINVGKALKSVMDSKDMSVGKETQDMFDDLKKDYNDVVNNSNSTPDQIKQAEALYMEEYVMTASEGMQTGDIKETPTLLTQLKEFGKTLSQFFKSGPTPINVKWNTGKDVYEFIKGFNKSVLEGKGLTKEQLDVAEKGAEGKLISKPTIVKPVESKSSKKLTNDSYDQTNKLMSDPDFDVTSSLDAKRALKAAGAVIETTTKRLFDSVLPMNRQGVTRNDFKKIIESEYIKVLSEYNADKDVNMQGAGKQTSTLFNLRANKLATENFKQGQAQSIDSEKAIQIADETSSKEFDEKAKEDTGRKKAYPSQMESISNTIKPETIASIKEDAKREILLNAKKGPDAIIKSIKEEARNIAKKLGKDTGTFKKGWPNFVNNIVKEGLTKVIPAAALKRRFGSVLNIKQTGVTPTKKVNPVTGKVTNFNKPVYDIPKAKDQDLIDYFTGQEKRKTSLLEVLGQDLVVEQMQELMNDSDFMSKLDTATDGKAVEIMDNLDKNLDARQLEDLSLDTVKSKKKIITPKKSEKGVQADQRNALPKGVKAIEQTPEDILKVVDFLLNDITKAFKDLSGLIVKASNLSPGNNALSAIKRGFAFISNFKQSSKENIKSNEQALQEGIVQDLSVAQNKIKKQGYSLAKADKLNKEALNKAIGSQVGKTKVIANQKIPKTIAKGKKIFYDAIKNIVKTNPKSIAAIQFILGNQNANSGIAKNLATLTNDATKPGDKNYEEHWFPTSQFVLNFIKSISKGVSTFNNYINFTNKHYYQEIISKETQAIVDATYDITLENGDVFVWKRKDNNHPLMTKAMDKAIDTNSKEAWDIVDSLADIRKYPGTNIKLSGGKEGPIGFVNPFLHGRNGVSDALRYGINVAKVNQKNPNIQYEVAAVIHEIILFESTNGKKGISRQQAKQRTKIYEPIANLEQKSSKKRAKEQPNKVNENMTAQQQIDVLGNFDKAAQLARSLNTPEKGISVFDFDDTLAKTKEKVIINMPDGSSKSISASQFAQQAGQLEKQGAEFDFTNFENVSKGTQKGPLADLALKRQDKFGSKDIFVLTARPQIAATGIKTFLDGIGLNLPLSNITGLENGTPQAKGAWVAGKAAEGYNNFYFADDAYKNVKAVSNILDQIDVKSKVQIAKSSKKRTFNTVMNNVLEDSTGIKSEAEFSRARAQTVGAKKGKFNFFTTPSAEDFVGLIYKFLGKGKVGDAQFQFFQDNLIDPYNRAEQAVTRAKITAANDFKALKNSLKTLPKSLSKQTGIGGFTFGQASRVAAWTRQGMEVPGLSKRDAKELNDFVKNKAELDVFVDELIKIQKGKPYPKPGQNWLAGNITSDIVNEINKVNRKEYMQEFNENVDIIFSDKVMNKLEAAYGPKYVEALRDTLRRMKSGSNRPVGNSRIVDGLLNWLNNSVGAIMFLNTRSAVLQTISAVNFINFGNNNLVAAGKAFANQKQYWKDFMTLFNSPYLVERRDGLKINVSESEIADAVAESSNKPKAFLNLLLNKGFVLTRFADSFAIAAGGSTFYRNQVAAYVKSGMDQKAAEKQAFDDFYAIAETSQQSSNPSKISQQQASGAGRVILAFANTPMQYARIIKRASQDLINGRGDWKTNVSKIVYYGAMQNLMFNALQTALFALAFGEEDEEQEDKTGRIANGMADSLLRGLGIQGAAVVAMKDALITIYEQANKEKGTPEFRKAIADLFGFSPPLDSKVRKLTSGLNTLSWEREKMSQEGFNLNNPAYLAFAQVLAGLTNVPLDRAIQKINNLRAVTSDSSAKWQKVALLMGWSTWDLGLPYYGVEDKVEMTPQMILKEKVTKMKKETSTKQQKETLLELGLTKQQIKALKYEEARVKKIIELQEKNKK